MDLDSLWDRLDDRVLDLVRRHRAELSGLRRQMKADHTVVTDADAAVEQCIVTALRGALPQASIVAEEGAYSTITQRRSSVWTWIVDPIDGTAQFVDPDAVEFASVVALLHNRTPVAAWVLMPEAGDDGPIHIRATATTVTVNGVKQTAEPRFDADHRALASVTGPDASLVKQAFVRECQAHAVNLKRRATSQTIDMMRTSLDLRQHATRLTPMVAFCRAEQKVWDGAAGIVVAGAMGRTVAHGRGDSSRRVDLDLGQPEPTFDVTFVGDLETRGWFEAARRASSRGVA